MMRRPVLSIGISPHWAHHHHLGVASDPLPAKDKEFANYPELVIAEVLHVLAQVAKQAREGLLRDRSGVPDQLDHDSPPIHRIG
jgi:hypothetical protein